MQSIKRTVSQDQDPSDSFLVRIPAALSEAQRQLGELCFDPDGSAALAAGQLKLIFARLQRGIPPGHESLANLIGVAAGVRGEPTEVGA